MDESHRENGYIITQHGIENSLYFDQYIIY